MTEDRIIKETLRYIGANTNKDDEDLVALAQEAIARVEQASKRHALASCLECYPVQSGVWFDDHFVRSVQLSEHLQGCREGYLFAATLGAEVDRLLCRDAVSRPSLAVAEQAAAAAVLEAYADEVCTELEQSLNGLHCRTRFSPGYGDFSLSEQVFLLQTLDATKRIGISCTDAFMLTPTKSITAVIGVSKNPSRCTAKGCECCSKTDCMFRR